MPFDKSWKGPEGNRVRRSIFLPEDVEMALAKMADERGTSVNDLIRELLEHAIHQDRGTPARPW